MRMVCDWLVAVFCPRWRLRAPEKRFAIQYGQTGLSCVRGVRRTHPGHTIARTAFRIAQGDVVAGAAQEGNPIEAHAVAAYIQGVRSLGEGRARRGHSDDLNWNGKQDSSIERLRHVTILFRERVLEQVTRVLSDGPDCTDYGIKVAARQPAGGLNSRQATSAASERRPS